VLPESLLDGAYRPCSNMQFWCIRTNGCLQKLRASKSKYNVVIRKAVNRLTLRYRKTQKPRLKRVSAEMIWGRMS